VLPADLPVVDHHCHLSPQGDAEAAVERFARAGGTHLFLSTQSYEARPPRSVEEYRAQFETTEALARRARERTGVVVYPVVAPYPVDLVEQAAALGLEAAADLHRAALRLAGRWVAERRAVALGEVGRPHFPVSEAIAAAADAAFAFALETARDADCPAVVHSEDLDAEGYDALGRLADGVGLARERVVKHYARRVRPPREEAGVVPSYLAGRSVLDEVGSRDVPWFLETDYLDDPRRPGAVLDLATVPRRASAWIAREPDGAERLRVPFQTAVERVYRIRPDPADARRRRVP
jgi:TatD-related deoxyribonuclease